MQLAETKDDPHPKSTDSIQYDSMSPEKRSWDTQQDAARMVVKEMSKILPFPDSNEYEAIIILIAHDSCDVC